MDNELLLLSGENIPFIEAQLTIHQPKLREISFIGESSFFNGARLLTFEKKMLGADKDNLELKDKTDFDIIMSIMSSSEKIEQKNDVILLLSLIFPNYQIKADKQEIILFNKDSGMSRINNSNYETFRDIITSMFCLNDSFKEDKAFNPDGKRAERIAKKLEGARTRKGKRSNTQTTKVAIYSQYISILSVGELKSINDLMNYTVYQITDEFKRFQKKTAYDLNIKARLAGATDLEDIDNWME